jgi:hypothetical protein
VSDGEPDPWDIPESWRVTDPVTDALEVHRLAILLQREAHNAYTAEAITEDEYGRTAHLAMSVQLALSELALKGFL